MDCPCGSGKSFASCCEPYLKGKENAPTPEALMRSRYTAYTQNDLAYIEKTMDGEALKRFHAERNEKKPEPTEWLKLDVLFSEEDKERGTVQFIATFRYAGKEHFMHEISTFEKKNGKWYYTKGTVS
ncbi:MAG: SEC-C domain-containing protein [Chlamydiia bacterium]|nr:SEC-C domain-containing protein [Chlamydiia bacterium]